MVNELVARCRLFYRKIYGFLSCAASVIAALLVLKVRAKLKGKELICISKELSGLGAGLLI